MVLVSADNDPDLVIARERYDSASRIQSIYLRLHDDAGDAEAVSGVIIFDGATISDVVFRRGALDETDATFGLPGIDYVDGDESRGLEGPDPYMHVPVERGSNDALRLEAPNRLRFWFGTSNDIDDIRVLIQLPPGASNASFDVQLYSDRTPDPAGLPHTTQAGIQVGSLVDRTPDDGDYSEVFEVRDIKLRIQDVDLIEERVDLGFVDGVTGGPSGVVTITVDNFGMGEDPDQDNGFDQNGLISPIPSSGDLVALRWRVVGLRSSARPGITVRADALVANAPARLGAGERLTFEGRINVQPDVPGGTYLGQVYVWEDNDGDRLIDATEPSDRLGVAIVIGPLVDAGLDDAGVDGGVDDATVPDFGVPPFVMQDAAPADADFSPDFGPRTDGGPDDDAGSEDDGGAAPDGAPDDDGGTGGAGGGAGGGSGGGAGGGPGGGAGGGADLDTGTGADGAAGNDSGTTADTDLGDARGGGLGCDSTRDAPALPVLLLLALWMAPRRRRTR
jgi:hypothetical protein